MKKMLIVAGAWIVTIVGAFLTPIPLPLPFPVGITMFLVGCAILTTHSKTFRRGLQYLRHRWAWLSHALEAIPERAPSRIRTMIRLTRPLAFGRHARMRARRAADRA